MGTERLISLIRVASARKCCIDRLLSAGLLTQIQHKHLAAGGQDIRKLTRQALLQMNVPIKARGRSSRQKATNTRISKFAAWANEKQKSQRELLGLKRHGRQPTLGDRTAYTKE